MLTNHNESSKDLERFALDGKNQRDQKSKTCSCWQSSWYKQWNTFMCLKVTSYDCTWAAGQWWNFEQNGALVTHSAWVCWENLRIAILPVTNYHNLLIEVSSVIWIAAKHSSNRGHKYVEGNLKLEAKFTRNVQLCNFHKVNCWKHCNKNEYFVCMLWN